MTQSTIEWTQHTWNPIVGCSILSPGCINCYAMKEAYRYGFNPKLERYHGLTKLVNGKAVWTGDLRRAPEATLLAPLKRKKPTIYFVNSMSDLFHEDCADEWIDQVFAVMALAQQHTFQVLTKRAERMRKYLTRPASDGKQSVANHLAWVAVPEMTTRWFPDWKSEGIHGPHRSRAIAATPWPLPNVWLGVSIERQQEANERIPHLLATPAAVRFISAEPLLGPINLDSVPVPDDQAGKYAGHGYTVSVLKRDDELKLFNAPVHLDWVIAGGESGKEARDNDFLTNARSLLAQCRGAGVPFFGKQNVRKTPLPPDLLVREFPAAWERQPEQLELA